MNEKTALGQTIKEYPTINEMREDALRVIPIATSIKWVHNYRIRSGVITEFESTYNIFKVLGDDEKKIEPYLLMTDLIAEVTTPISILRNMSLYAINGEQFDVAIGCSPSNNLLITGPDIGMMIERACKVISKKLSIWFIPKYEIDGNKITFVPMLENDQITWTFQKGDTLLVEIQ